MAVLVKKVGGAGEEGRSLQRVMVTKLHFIGTNYRFSWGFTHNRIDSTNLLFLFPSSRVKKSCEICSWQREFSECL